MLEKFARKHVGMHSKGEKKRREKKKRKEKIGAISLANIRELSNAAVFLISWL